MKKQFLSIIATGLMLGGTSQIQAMETTGLATVITGLESKSHLVDDLSTSDLLSALLSNKSSESNTTDDALSSNKISTSHPLYGLPTSDLIFGLSILTHCPPSDFEYGSILTRDKVNRLTQLVTQENQNRYHQYLIETAFNQSSNPLIVKMPNGETLGVHTSKKSGLLGLEIFKTKNQPNSMTATAPLNFEPLIDPIPEESLPDYVARIEAQKQTALNNALNWTMK